MTVGNCCHDRELYGDGSVVYFDDFLNVTLSIRLQSQKEKNYYASLISIFVSKNYVHSTFWSFVNRSRRNHKCIEEKVG